MGILYRFTMGDGAPPGLTSPGPTRLVLISDVITDMRWSACYQ